MIKAREEARRAGKIVYQGVPCAQGHDGKRYVRSSACVTCQRARRTGKIPREVRQKNGRKGFAAMREAIAAAASITPPRPTDPVPGNGWPGSRTDFKPEDPRAIQDWGSPGPRMVQAGRWGAAA